MLVFTGYQGQEDYDDRKDVRLVAGLGGIDGPVIVDQHWIHVLQVEIRRRKVSSSESFTFL